MLRRIERGRHGRRRRDDVVVIRVAEDELAGRHALAVEARNRRLRDAVAEPKRFGVRCPAGSRAGPPPHARRRRLLSARCAAAPMRRAASSARSSRAWMITIA